jgi:hypothetical protein
MRLRSSSPEGSARTFSRCNGQTAAQPARIRPSESIALAITPPQFQLHIKAEPDIYAAKARSVIIRHVSNHQIIAMLESAWEAVPSFWRDVLTSDPPA